MPRKPKHTNNANPEMAKAMREKRSSNAAGTHQDKRTKRARTRGALLRKLLKLDEQPAHRGGLFVYAGDTEKYESFAANTWLPNKLQFCSKSVII